MGLFQPKAISMPGTLAKRNRRSSCTSNWLRLRFLRFFNVTLMLPLPLLPNEVVIIFTSGTSRTMASTWRILSSARCRLVPTGMVTATWVKPWSVCGTPSKPMKLAIPNDATSDAMAAHNTTPRGVRVATCGLSGVRLRCFQALHGFTAGSQMRQRRLEKTQAIVRA